MNDDNDVKWVQCRLSPEQHRRLSNAAASSSIQRYVRKLILDSFETEAPGIDGKGLTEVQATFVQRYIDLLRSGADPRMALDAAALTQEQVELVQRYIDLLRSGSDPEFLVVLKTVLNRAKTSEKRLRMTTI